MKGFKDTSGSVSLQQHSARGCVSGTNLALTLPAFPKPILKDEGELSLTATALQMLSLLRIVSLLHSAAFWEISSPGQLVPAVVEQRLSYFTS